MKRVLVTGAGGNAAINFIDSLRISGEDFYIVGTDTSLEHLECSPVDARYLVPKVNSPEYLTSVRKIIKHEKIDFLHPQPDIEVKFWGENFKQVSCLTYLPPLKSIEICHDKASFAKMMREANIQVPKYYVISDFEDLKKKFDKLKRGSDVIWCRARRGAGSKAALPVKSYEQARDWIKYWVEMKGLRPVDFMISEFLPGKEFAFQSLWMDGQLVCSMVRERIEYMFGSLMPSGQSSSPSIARTVHRDDVNETSTNAILALGEKPSGIYCVDLKENSASDPCVTEINIGRFFTTSNFFSHAGLNMPYIYLKMAFGEKFVAPEKYNSLPPDLFWVRGVDRVPKLFRDKEWTSKKSY